jgi:hypothetical protein
MVVARGVAVLSKLGLVSIWYSAESEAVLLTLPWWKPQSGQSLIEYASLLGIGGVLAWGLWSMLGLTVTEIVRIVLDVLAPGSSWLVSG